MSPRLAVVFVSLVLVGCSNSSGSSPQLPGPGGSGGYGGSGAGGGNASGAGGASSSTDAGTDAPAGVEPDGTWSTPVVIDSGIGVIEGFLLAKAPDDKGVAVVWFDDKASAGFAADRFSAMTDAGWSAPETIPFKSVVSQFSAARSSSGTTYVMNNATLAVRPAAGGWTTIDPIPHASTNGLLFVDSNDVLWCAYQGEVDVGGVLVPRPHLARFDGAAWTSVKLADEQASHAVQLLEPTPGTLMAVWSVATDSTPGALHHFRYVMVKNGVPDAPATIVDAPLDFGVVAASTDRAGTTFVAWEGKGSAYVAAHDDAAGWSSPLLLGESNPGTARVYPAAIRVTSPTARHALVSWTHDDPNDKVKVATRFARYVRGDTQATFESRVGCDFPTLTGDSSGNEVLTWLGGPNFDTTGLYAERYRARLGWTAPKQLIDDNTAYTVGTETDATTLADASTLVVYMTSGGHKLMSVRYVPTPPAP